MAMNRKLFDALHAESWGRQDQQTAGATFPAPNERMPAPGPHWAIAYHTNSHSPRARRWYRITRLVYADGALWELYWHADATMRGNSAPEIRAKAKAAGLDLLPGVYRDSRERPRIGSRMERAS